MKSQTHALFAFIFAATALFLFKLTVSEPAHTDEIFFKSAGLSWANGQGWRSPEESGYGGWSPPLDQVFASYPPLYPFLFGCLVKLLGFSWQVSAAYDAAIHIALSAILIIFARRALPDHPMVPWLLGILFLSSGYTPRPDRLAMIFGYTSLAATLVPAKEWTSSRSTSIGVLFGLCVGTSIPCAVALMPLLISLIAVRHRPFSNAISRLSHIGLVSFITASCVILPVYLYHPGAFDQNIAATSAITNYPFIPSIHSLLRYWYPTIATFALLLFPYLVESYFALTTRKATQIRHCFVWFGPVLPPVLFFFTRSTFQGSYYWFFIPWLAVGLFRPWAPKLAFPVNRTAYLALAFLPIVAFATRFDLSALVTPSHKRISAYRSRVESIIPVGASVACRGDFWWLLARRNRVLDLLNHEALTPTQADYIILTGIGAGSPGSHQSLPPFTRKANYETAENLTDSISPSILGIRLSRSTSSPAPVIIRRNASTNSPPPASAQ